MSDYEVSKTVAGLTEGQDYEAGILMVTADSQEEAEVYAGAFSGELVSYSFGVAEIRPLTATVSEAVSAAEDMSLPLPAAYPNYLVRLDPVESDSDTSASAAGTAVPSEQNWNTWVNENMSSPDPYLRYPTSSNYQYMHDVVDTYAAWGVTTGRTAVKVAVIDSGVQADHPDLNGKVTQISVGSGTADENGHGTHVAGIIAATMNNALGGAGIAPNVSILSIRVLDASGSGSDAVITRGINAAVSNGAMVINMSLGGYFYNGTMQTAIKNAVAKGVTVVAAMGNDGTNCVNYPAAYDGVIAVVATDATNNRAFYSNYGPWADVAAPGSSVISTCINSTYTFKSGTSMACPVVTGVVALYMSKHGWLSPAVIESRLKATATKGGSDLGAGIVNAAKMMSEIPQAPGFRILDGSGSIIADSATYSGQTVPCESKLRFYMWGADNAQFILYTLDGKNPSVKDGVVVNGNRVLGGTAGEIDLSAYAGSSVTVKAVQVNGLGMVGKVLTQKVTVAPSTQITGVSIIGPSTLVAGKSVELTAQVLPLDKVDQSVTWKVLPNTINATISKTGKLTVPKNVSGTITVEARSTVDTNKFGTLKITVKVQAPVAKMALNLSSASCLAGKQLQLSVASMTDTSGKTVNPSDVDVQWISSNTKLATVDSNGKVTALAKGRVTITCKALDGSNKSAKCSVTITKPVESIAITGMLSIAPGSSATYKAQVYPADAGSKKISWGLSGAPTGTTVSASGAVSVPAGAPLGRVFTLTAYSLDGSGVSGSLQIKIANKCSGLYITSATGVGYAPGAVYSSSGRYHVSTVGLFNVDLPNTSAAENVTKLGVTAEGTTPYIAWSSSNPKIATVDGSGNVTAHGAGSVKITAAALDGSNKKATVTVNVTVPTSSISISSSTARMGKSTLYLAFGKSATNKAVFADTYGKPSNQKVTWSFRVKEYGGSNSGADRTSYCVSNKLVSLNNGKLAIKADMVNYWADLDGDLQVVVRATATDGTGVYAEATYTLVHPATQMFIESGYSKVNCSANKGYKVSFYCNQWFLGGNSANGDFIVTSSNPKVASVVEVNHPSDYYAGWYDVIFATGKPGTKGTAKITIKTTDGSNKSCSFTVYVK